MPNAGAVGTVVNWGTIEVTGPTTIAAHAVDLASGGTVTNNGIIEGGNGDGIDIGSTAGGAGTVINFGTISSTMERGVYLRAKRSG